MLKITKNQLQNSIHRSMSYFFGDGDVLVTKILIQMRFCEVQNKRTEQIFKINYNSATFKVASTK
ncbi:hypothetical protein BpHYR1_024994 [Brachionus plicatilis]|uniref:Uncharacterized protein n=1 Tax=Brachionus plicatilis TaxID=10195 RepID=A0A3M7RV11_BRAPC|nr:hypothetical protein BpHYR1_024994 [Brachionus plicatilis]